MYNEDLLRKILYSQKLTQDQKTELISLRETISQQIKGTVGGDPHVWYGGSFRKDTMIRESYDLDVVVLWKSYFPPSLEELFTLVGDTLRRDWPQKIKPKRVCWRIDYDVNFHIDVVPGRYAKTNGRFAYLYDNQTGKFLLTSIEIHNKFVQDSGRQDVIRLLKLWKLRKHVPIRTFILEQLAIEGCSGLGSFFLEEQLRAALNYISRNILKIQLIDPANKRNIITNDLTFEDRSRIQKLSWEALNEEPLGRIFS